MGFWQELGDGLRILIAFLASAAIALMITFGVPLIAAGWVAPHATGDALMAIATVWNEATRGYPLWMVIPAWMIVAVVGSIVATRTCFRILNVD